MYCPNCGKLISGGDVYCKFCGRNVKNPDTPFNNHPSSTTSDFITLNCPRCGGNLKVQPNMSTLVCQFCGAEHIVRNSTEGVSLESYARCPTCRRNDKAVKVTVKFGDLPNPPYKTSLDWNYPWGLMIFVYTWFLLIGAFAYWLDPQYVKYVVIGFLITITINTWQFLKGKSRVKKHNSEIVDVNRQMEDTYHQSKKIWDALYYCERDDTYFSSDNQKQYTKEEIKTIFPWWTEVENYPYGY